MIIHKLSVIQFCLISSGCYVNSYIQIDVKTRNLDKYKHIQVFTGNCGKLMGNNTAVCQVI